MEVCYTKPEPPGEELYDPDTRSEHRSMAGKSMKSTTTMIRKQDETNPDLLEDKEYVVKVLIFLVALSSV